MYRGKGVVFDPYGNILPCTHFGDAPLFENNSKQAQEVFMGDKFWTFWNNKNSPAGKFREALWQFPTEKCKNCDMWGACIGGCPLLWSHFDPRDYIT